MDPAVKTYQSSFLMMALSGPKHVGVNHKCTLIFFCMKWKGVGFQDVYSYTAIQYSIRKIEPLNFLYVLSSHLYITVNFFPPLTLSPLTWKIW